MGNEAKLDLNDERTQLLLRAIEYKKKYCIIESLFPNTGKYRRKLYPKHLIHFHKGAQYRQRLFMCANRVGKTTAAGCELTYHLTGEYPHWWRGKVFTAPQDWWACGKYAKTILDILQKTLLGEVGSIGTGLIPRHLLELDSMTTAKKADTLITDFRVKHKSGAYSTVGFRSYDQGRKAFEGTSRSIWLDEEPPLEIYQECLMRTMTPLTNGEDNIIMMTFTPLEGMSDTVVGFLGEGGDYKEGEKGEGKWCTTATWDDVPHLTESSKKELYGSYPEYQRDARTKGIPQLGAGAVYPVSIDKVFIEPIPIPDHFKRVFALDFGFVDPTAILWAAIDPATDICYVYAEHYLREQPPMVHAAIIKQRAKLAKFTIPGVCDPSGGGRGVKDGEHTVKVYWKEYTIRMKSAINSIEPGITTVIDLLVTDKLKIFNTCIQTKREFQLYRRNERGALVGDDHLMDCLRYLCMSGRKIAKSYTEIVAARNSGNKIYEPDAFYTLKDFWLYT